MGWYYIWFGSHDGIVCELQFFLFGPVITGTMETLYMAAGWINCLAPIPFILNFFEEAKQVESADSSNLSSENWLNILIILCFGLAVFFGLNSFGRVYDLLHVSKEAVAAEPFERGFYTDKSGDSLHYRYIKPKVYQTGKKYPLVVCLPFVCADDNERQILGNGPVQWLMEEGNRSKYPAFIFVPACPRGAGWGGVRNTRSVANLALNAIARMTKRPDIDARRIYITGVSRGGFGSWQFIGTRPDLFAAAVPICGGGNPALAAKMKEVAVWAFHGAKDKNVPVSGSRTVITAIKQAGGHPRYIEFPGHEHNIFDEVKATPGLLDWMFAQRKE
jgi:predicted peptidase